jgi:penicillin-binding protein 2
MLIFDQLKKRDPRLRAVALVFAGGLAVLLAGLWWVQIVSARDYQANLQMQSFRTVRNPAVRGKILDRNGKVLAENRPTYNVSLYLEELRAPVEAAYTAEVGRARTELKQQQSALEKKLGRKLTKEEKKQFVLTPKLKGPLRQKASCQVASNVVAQVSQRLGQPLSLDVTTFLRHCSNSLALPFPIVTNLTPLQIARFQEQATSPMGVDIETQSTRVYPFQTTAAHVIGYVQRNLDSVEGEEAYFSYRLPGFRGQLGVEAGYDEQLRGKAGAKSVLVNSVGFRQNENVWRPAEPGQNVTLTIDLFLQQATERALQRHSPTPLAAAVVMEVHSGDILAMASIPTYNPSHTIEGFPPGEQRRRYDPALGAEPNRATQGSYFPGSIFKTVVGLAALEAGLDPAAKYRVEPDPQHPGKGCIFLGGQRKVKDTAPPGEYNFRTALKISSNSYFIFNGLRAGIANIVALGRRLHLGERTDLHTRQEVSGRFPDARRISSRWYDGDTANLCIGQEAIEVTPLQMAVLSAALANGGTVLWPRLVERIEPQSPLYGEPTNFPAGRVRDQLGVSRANLDILRQAMLADVEDSDGTGRHAQVEGLRICGKTGTAQREDGHGKIVSHQTWFISFAPYENPRYAVVVLVDGGTSGGGDCAPIAARIYEAIRDREKMGTPKATTLTRAD